MEENKPNPKIIKFKEKVKELKKRNVRETGVKGGKGPRDYRDMTDEEVTFHDKVDDLERLLTVADTIVDEICELEKIAFNAKDISESLARLLTNWKALNEIFDKFYKDC